MKKISIFLIGLISCALIGSTKLNYSQSITALIEKNSKEIIKEYVQPLATTFGTALGSGLYHTAKTHSLGGFDVGIKIMIIPIPIEAKTFDAKILTTQGEKKIVSSTIFGSEKETLTNGFPPVLPGGLGLSSFIIPIPQINIGLIKGVEIMGRFLSIPFKEDNLLFYGIAGKYELTSLPILGTLPLLNIAFQVAYHSVNLEDIVNVNIISFNVHTSKNFIFITPYLGLGIDKTKMQLNYTYKEQITNITVPVDVTIEGENKTRVVIGASISLFLLNINAEYNLGQYPSYNLGIKFSFR